MWARSIGCSAGRGTGREAGFNSPDGLKTGAPDLAIAGHQGKIQRERSGRYDAIGKVRNLGPRNSTRGAGHVPIESGEAETELRLRQYLADPLGHCFGNSSLIDEVDEFDQTHGRHVNGVAFA